MRAKSNFKIVSHFLCSFAHTGTQCTYLCDTAIGENDSSFWLYQCDSYDSYNSNVPYRLMVFRMSSYFSRWEFYLFWHRFSTLVLNIILRHGKIAVAHLQLCVDGIDRSNSSLSDPTDSRRNGSSTCNAVSPREHSHYYYHPSAICIVYDYYPSSHHRIQELRREGIEKKNWKNREILEYAFVIINILQKQQFCHRIQTMEAHREPISIPVLFYFFFFFVVFAVKKKCSLCNKRAMQSIVFFSSPYLCVYVFCFLCTLYSTFVLRHMPYELFFVKPKLLLFNETNACQSLVAYNFVRFNLFFLARFSLCFVFWKHFRMSFPFPIHDT